MSSGALWKRKRTTFFLYFFFGLSLSQFPQQFNCVAANQQDNAVSDEYPFQVTMFFNCYSCITLPTLRKHKIKTQSEIKIKARKINHLYANSISRWRRKQVQCSNKPWCRNAVVSRQPVQKAATSDRNS